MVGKINLQYLFMDLCKKLKIHVFRLTALYTIYLQCVPENIYFKQKEQFSIQKRYDNKADPKKSKHETNVICKHMGLSKK